MQDSWTARESVERRLSRFRCRSCGLALAIAIVDPSISSAVSRCTTSGSQLLLRMVGGGPWQPFIGQVQADASSLVKALRFPATSTMPVPAHAYAPIRAKRSSGAFAVMP